MNPRSTTIEAKNLTCVYAANWQEMLINAGYSTGILVVGFSISTTLGIFEAKGFLLRRPPFGRRRFFAQTRP